MDSALVCLFIELLDSILIRFTKSTVVSENLVRETNLWIAEQEVRCSRGFSEVRLCFLKRFVKGWSKVRPRFVQGSSGLLERLDVDERKKYDSEKKAYWMLSQAIPIQILHQFDEHKTSYGLWNALKARVQGNSNLKKMKATDIQVRKCCIEYSEDEKIDFLADALPDKWKSLVLILRENLPGLTLVEFVQKIEEQNIKDKRKARRVNVTQDPSLYGGSVVTPPASSVKIQTAFVSSTSDSTHVPSTSTSSSSSYYNNEKKSDSTPPPVQLNTTNLGKVTVEAVRDHMSILSIVVSAYDEQVAGRIGNANLTFEDYEQIDDDEMELIDIQWALASVIRRINRYE
ncbi:hypothetical protein E3N88_29227 [Mikania micrantha]|uniref:Uncharacterized protein n=1 Tax=Mikania micrantha TaxID=192012 RepID=A0A5N6ML43_9ASTR|nr:hypothetical protein E3N88_29227 [Mikania micrantha]